MSVLPIDIVLPSIIDAVERSTPVVLKAPPGAGKTTGVPPALMSSHACGDGQILLIQPRRLAARSAAARIAHLVHTDLGDRVGYHVRFDRKATESSELIVMTTGILLRRLQSDPLLENVACVILDEFHERSLELDLALGMLHRVRTTFRDDLKLIVMSATLDPQPIVEFLGDAEGIESAGRSFPVEIRYARQHTRDRIENQVAACLPGVLKSTTGDVLVFLPGVGEIKRTAGAIAGLANQNGSDVMQLYGDLSPADQDRVLRPSTRRKIVLSTNVAETSVTIPGVTAVIDSGQARVMSFDASVGLPNLRMQAISKASADQRAGRAGRTQPGVCHRLWPEAMHRSRPDRDVPEILRGDLSAAVLMLAAWGETDLPSFPWLSPPDTATVQSATELLQNIGALSPSGRVTPIGQRITKLPLHPRLGRLLIAAEEHNVIRRACMVAALLGDRDPFRETNVRGLHAKVNALEEFDRGSRIPDIHESAARQIVRVAKQLQRDFRTPQDDGIEANDDALTMSLLAAFPDRVAKRRRPGSDRGVMVGGRGVKLDRQLKQTSDSMFLCIDVDAGDTEAKVRLAVPIDPAWLPGHLMRIDDEVLFHPTRRAVVTRQREYFDDLLLSEVPVESSPNKSTAAMLFTEAKRHWQHAFPVDDANVAGFVSRVTFLNEHSPALLNTVLDEATIDEVLSDLCSARLSLADLKSAPWLDHLRGRFSYDQLLQIDREAPTRMTVPGGKMHAIDYADINAPTMSVKLQELFGWTETPRLAGGQVPLRMQLLGPNGRPQQITDDLASFWSTTYAQIRKDLRGRYPKHFWPEDPLTAKATRNGLKPK